MSCASDLSFFSLSPESAARPAVGRWKRSGAGQRSSERGCVGTAPFSHGPRRCSATLPAFREERPGVWFAAMTKAFLQKSVMCMSAFVLFFNHHLQSVKSPQEDEEEVRNFKRRTSSIMMQHALSLRISSDRRHVYLSKMMRNNPREASIKFLILVWARNGGKRARGKGSLCLDHRCLRLGSP